MSKQEEEIPLAVSIADERDSIELALITNQQEESTNEISTTDLDENKRGKALHYLFIAQFLSSWSDRTWEYGSAIIFTYIFTGTYLPGVLFSFVCQTCNFLSGSHIGNWVDKSPHRLLVIQRSLIAQNTSVCICAMILLYFFRFTAETVPWKNPSFLFGFIVMNVFGSVASLFSMARDIAVTKDWVVVLTAKDSTVLSSTNAMMKRINLTCKFLSPFFVSSLLSLIGTKATVILIALWNLFSLIPEYLLLTSIAKMHDRLRYAKRNEEATKSKNPLKVLYSGWKIYLQQPVLLASLAYVFLFINGVTPGSLTNSWLKLKGAPIFVVGAFSGIGALGGLTATFFVPTLIRKIGVASTGLWGIWMQNLFNLLALGSFVFIDQHPFMVYLFISLIIISRIGLWTFDLVEVQIMQEGIEEEYRGVVNGVEYSLTNLAYLIVLGLASVFNKPEQYIVIVMVSYAALLIASSLYTVWVKLKSNKT